MGKDGNKKDERKKESIYNTPSVRRALRTKSILYLFTEGVQIKICLVSFTSCQTNGDITYILFTHKKIINDTPHSELRIRTELNQKTSKSGHRNLCHIIESTSTVKPERGYPKGVKVSYTTFT